MSDAETLTAEEIDALVAWAGSTNLDDCDVAINKLAAQAKRVPELEAERVRYRKVAEDTLAFLRLPGAVESGVYYEAEEKLHAALAAVGMKVGE
jgi:hypothetical protein